MRQILFLLAICIAIQTTPSFAERIQVKRNISGREIGVKSRLTTTNDIQSLADVAALAGAGAIRSDTCPSCTARQRWDNAREVALQVVQSSSASRHIYNSVNLLGPGSTPTPSLGRTFPTYNIDAKVERGRWLPKRRGGRRLPGLSNKNGKFESFEGDWQAKHPGVPNFMAFNAVRVTLKKSINVNKRVGRFLSTKAKSTAVVSLPQDVVVAPLAIPVCALLDGATGDYNPDNTCLADRLFTSTNRHCPASDPNCGNIPQFSWDPMLSYPISSYYWGAKPRGLGTYCDQYPSNNGGWEDTACFWCSPRYLEAGDNYGVIGSPDPYTDTHSESEIVAKLISGQSMSIGGAFFTYTAGLGETASEDTIWARVTTKVENSFGDNFAFNQTDLYIPASIDGMTNTIPGWNKNTNSAFKDLDRCKLYENDPSWPGDQSNPAPKDDIWNGEIGGACNSKRSGWGHWTQFSDCGGSNWMQCYDSYQDPFASQLVWQVPIAVIADAQENAMPCANMQDAEGNIASSDPPIGAGPYEIIGFLKANIYDLDIGHDPPTFPSGSPFNSTKQWYYTQTTDSANDPSYPWGFTSKVTKNGVDEAQAMDCNLIRSRLVCNQNPIPAAQGAGTTQPDPVLVPDD